MVALGVVVNFAAPPGAIMVSPEWENVDFYGSLDRWKMHFWQLCTLRC